MPLNEAPGTTLGSVDDLGPDLLWKVARERDKTAHRQRLEKERLRAWSQAEVLRESERRQRALTGGASLQTLF